MEDNIALKWDLANGWQIAPDATIDVFQDSMEVVLSRKVKGGNLDIVVMPSETIEFQDLNGDSHKWTTSALILELADKNNIPVEFREGVYKPTRTIRQRLSSWWHGEL